MKRISCPQNNEERAQSAAAHPEAAAARSPQDYPEGDLYNICPSCGRVFRSKGRKYGHIFCRECNERHARTAAEHGM